MLKMISNAIYRIVLTDFIKNNLLDIKWANNAQPVSSHSKKKRSTWTNMATPSTNALPSVPKNSTKTSKNLK